MYPVCKITLASIIMHFQYIIKIAFLDFNKMVEFTYSQYTETENTNKALMIMGRNLSQNHIKRPHIKSVHLIKCFNAYMIFFISLTLMYLLLFIH